MFERPQSGERAILVHASADGAPEESEREEFAELARSAGALIVDEIICARRKPDARYFIGKGKLEDVAESAYKDLPYYAVAQAVFALTYAHKKVDVIPDMVSALGRADDSSVVRAVLIQNEKVFAKYAETRGMDWAKITSRA